MLTDLLRPAATSPARRLVSIADVVFGAGTIPIIAGPCAVEPDYLAHAIAVCGAGATVLRGSIHKPRTRPDSFQGLGESGLALLDAARNATGAPVLVEPLEISHVEKLTGRVDALMIGARSMQNTPLLRAAGRSGLPVVLKRGMSATYDEWLAAAEYILAEGNEQVILCERGIRTFETATRNTLDLSAIPVLRERTPLPIIVDPSHASGRSEWVPPLALAAVAAGADGLLIEAHPLPASAWSDAAQAITPETLADIVAAVRVLAPLLRLSQSAAISEQRKVIDSLDVALGAVLENRAAVVERIQREKKQIGMGVRDKRRESEVVANVAGEARRLKPAAVGRVMTAVMDACVEAAVVDTGAAAEIAS